jgi:VCBS repeat-containing protein
VTDAAGNNNSTSVLINVNATNDTPVLATVTNAALTDSVIDNTFADIAGTLSGSDRDTTDTVSFELTGSTSTPAGANLTAGFNVQSTTSFGTFYLNSTSGAYKFVANDGAVEALKTAGEQVLTFNVNSTDGNADSASQAITITLNGTPSVGTEGTNDATVKVAAFDAELGIVGVAQNVRSW